MSIDIHDLIKIKRMGVINITPDSFSGEGEIPSLSKITDTIKNFGPIECIDLGAESTAPKSHPIDAQTEWARFQDLGLEVIEKIPHQTIISIDTYHPETIFKMSKVLKGRPLIWNDVSGQVDADVENFLVSLSNVHYVLSHNLSPSRKMTNSHMNYVSQIEDNIFFWDMVSFFAEKLKIFKEKKVSSRVIFDPCFGFSKSLEQNIYLMKNFVHLAREVNHPAWLIGISRKSFLRHLHGIDIVTPQSREFLDQNHEKDLREILADFPYAFIWVRTHRPELLPTSFQLS